MPPAVADDVALNQADYYRAVAMLAHGQVQAGAHLLGEIARRSTDGELRSKCLFNIAEVLDQLGDTHKAYDAWYRLAHKPRDKRNSFDRSARDRCLRMFEARGLHIQPPDFPPKVQVEITNRCNLRCIMCTRNQMNRPLGDMSLETFRRVADQVCEEPGCVLAMYFLGEPLLNRELEEMVRYVAPRSPDGHFGIQTNGMLLTPARATSLLEAGLRNFAFSLDALEGNLERIRVGAKYPVIERNILGLIEQARRMGLSDLRVEISKLCDDPAADEVKRFRERWEGKVDVVHLNGISRVEGNSFMAADGTVRLIASQTGASGGYCGEGRRLLVHWNGDYAFCCSDINRGINLGTVHDRSIREVWNSPRIQEIRRLIFAGEYSSLPACAACRAGRR